MADRAELPVVSLENFEAADASTRERTAASVDGACRQHGFLIIEDHGVANDIITNAWNAARAFFDQPLQTKLKTRSADANCPRGYFPQQSETLSRSLEQESPPDLKESFSIGPTMGPNTKLSDADTEFFFGSNLWPSNPPEFREAWLAYYAAMEDLGARLMRLLANSLSLDADFFRRFHTHHLGALRALNYPKTTATRLPKQRGAGEHTDYGSVTILKPDPDVAGLEIRMPDGQWHPAPQIQDGFLVNIGDMLARWTNDRWVSTLHRVSTTPERRQAIAYFMNPNYDAEIRALPSCLPSGDSPKYPPTLAGPYLLRKFSSTV